MERFAGRVAVITGGADGIGKALAIGLVAKGMKVALLDIRAEAVNETAAQIGECARGYACDITLKDSIEAAAKAVEADFGAISLLCANAGVGAAGGPLSAKDKVIDWILSVNQKGTLDTLRVFRPLLRDEAGPRHVVITASSAALVSPNAAGLALYGGSKHCTMGIAEAAAAELAADRIGTTILCPGLINTRIWDGARARPDHFGGPRYMPEETGDYWRESGMPVEWVVEEAIGAIDRGDRYCAPIHQTAFEEFEDRVAAIRAGMKLWQERDTTRWPETGSA